MEPSKRPARKARKSGGSVLPPLKEIRAYVVFAPPGDKPGHFKEGDLFALLAEASEWKQGLQKADLEAKLKASKKSLRAVKARTKALLATEGIDVSKVFRRERKNTKPEPLVEARFQLHDAIYTLIPEMAAGNKEVAGTLLRAAAELTLFLEAAYRSKPELFHHCAGGMTHIPVLASLDPSWVATAQDYLKTLALGSDRAQGHFKNLAWQADRHVCRGWAREAVDMIDRNREFASCLSLIRLYVATGNCPDLKLGKSPNWLRDVGELPPFSKTTAKEWGLLARRMIRDEVPEFHEREEFKELVANITQYRNVKGAAGRLKGTVQNALLDRIMEAIQSIAA